MKFDIRNKEHMNQFMELVKQYGSGKWTVIANVFKINGITVDTRQLLSLWNSVNRPNALPLDQFKELTKLAIISKGNKEQYYQEFVDKFKRNDEKQNYQLVGKCQRNIRKILQRLIKIFCHRKFETQKQFHLMRTKSIVSYLQIGNLKNTTGLLAQISISTNILCNTMLAYLDNHTRSRSKIYEECAKHTNRSNFDKGIQYILYINALYKICDGTIVNAEQIEECCNEYLLPTIEENQCSELYQYLCMPNKFLKYYNEAIQTTLPQNFVYKLKDTVKHKAVPQVLKEIPVKKKLKTVRGHIQKEGKLTFRNNFTSKFAEELQNNLQEDYESDPLIQQQIQELQSEQIPSTMVEQEYERNLKMQSYVQEKLQAAKNEAYKLYKQS